MSIKTVLVIFMSWLAMAQATMMELTHVMNKNSGHWPDFISFNMTNISNGTKPDGLWVYANNLMFAEHTGTHMDAPAHTWLGGIKLDEVSLENLITPAVVIDVIDKVKANQDYLLVVQDILDHEAEYGMIPEKAMVFMNTDGDKTYWDKAAYFGSSTPDDTSTLHFPAFDGPVVTWLIENRNINAIGVDRVSIDAGQNPGGKAHKALLSQGKYALENVHNLGKIPRVGATVITMPMLVENGSGAPARVVAFWGSDTQIPISSGAGKQVVVTWFALISILIAVFTI